MEREILAMIKFQIPETVKKNEYVKLSLRDDGFHNIMVDANGLTIIKICCDGLIKPYLYEHWQEDMVESLKLMGFKFKKTHDGSFSYVDFNI